MDQFGGPLGGGLAVVSAGSCAALDDFADLVESALLPHVINYASKLQIYSSRIWIQWNDFSDRTLFYLMILQKNWLI